MVPTQPLLPPPPTQLPVKVVGVSTHSFAGGPSPHDLSLGQLLTTLAVNLTYWSPHDCAWTELATKKRMEKVKSDLKRYLTTSTFITLNLPQTQKEINRFK